MILRKYYAQNWGSRSRHSNTLFLQIIKMSYCQMLCLEKIRRRFDQNEFHQ